MLSLSIYNISKQLYFLHDLTHLSQTNILELFLLFLSSLISLSPTLSHDNLISLQSSHNSTKPFCEGLV